MVHNADNKRVTHKSDLNRLCGSCRRSCKQPIFAVMVSCPRYYAFKNKVQLNYKQWIQQPLPFASCRMLTKSDVETILTKQIFIS